MDTYPNRPWTSSSMAIRPRTIQARSLRSDRALAKLGLYEATELKPSSVATPWLNHSLFLITRKNRGPQRKLGFPDFPPITEIDGVNFGFHSLALEGGVRNNAGKTTPAAAAPMANAYANATVLEKIENLSATFRHRKCNETSSRFLFLNIKGNDKSYQTP
ncbi:hypothetical protein F2Q69_00058522 [Brassica cretica]|uniref:Uncharacterized protein n=1 Tax=Brassica cretica TaxID=69181 RepID=A0A8S9RIU0_BRACR|nr:hypothetical protein F2Q69_00058522 [Brassica cretica]